MSRSPRGATFWCQLLDPVVLSERTNIPSCMDGPGDRPDPGCNPARSRENDRARGDTMESDDVIPGKPSTVPCPHCGGTVQFMLTGGPQHLRCSVCGATMDLDVVHD